ncbi:dUTP diphosphatase [Candidatus Woesearchaeota archaeon]|nr:MAG: dUTP diphosphatase [Candidatus Woesearchaeota archaeon]
MLKVKVQKIRPDAIVPYYAHKGDSGVDLFANETKEIKPGERTLISTGIKIAVPEGYEAQVRPKSGLALKHGITVLNTPGTVDSGYRGEVGVIVINLGNEKYLVEKGKKIAQMVFQKVEEAELEEVEALDETSRNEGGFGSTGLEHKEGKD